MSGTQLTERTSDIFPAANAAGVGDARAHDASARSVLQPATLERVFAALRETVRPDVPGLGRPFTRGEVFRGQMESHWAAATVVSFDIFDTAIVRKVQAPVDVFLFLADHEPFRGRGTHHHFAQLRREAEQVARRRVYAATGSGEAALAEIHTALAALAGFDALLIPQMVAAEEAIELALCITHPHLHEVYRRAHAADKTVWFVSDTYHSATFLRRLLASAGYEHPNDRIVASCDERCSKGSGKLLPLLVQAAGLSKQQFLHIGDNMRSDCALPSQAGINGVWHPLAGAPEGATPSRSREEAVSAGVAAWGVRTFEPTPSFWRRFGFGVAGPLLVGFSWWLEQKMREDGAKRAYFLLRDGDILKRVYDALTDGEPGAIPSALLESSRRAYMLPALGPAAPSLTTQLFVSENPRPVGEFLTRLRIRIDDLGAEFARAGFSSPKEMVAGNDIGRLSALFSAPRIIDRISRRSAEERELLMAYLRQEGVVGGVGRVALVDIGWNATIQKSLNHAAKIANVQADVVGYYLGTFAPAAVDAISPMRGYLTELGQPHERVQPLYEFRQLIEFICTSPRGSLLHFQYQGKRVAPVVAEPDHDDTQMQAIRELHDGALDYARIMRDEARTLGVRSLDPESAARALYRVIASPTPEEAETIGSITHGDGMGASASRAFARFGEGAYTPDSILTDYGRAYWKAGMLNQHTVQALVLRSLLWLHER